MQVHYRDKDSFFLSLKTEDPIKDLKSFKDDFDFSELDQTHQLYDPINKKIIGKLKIETSQVLVLDGFQILQSKSYSFSFNNNPNGTQSYSGIIRKAKQKRIKSAPECEDYINSLFMSETTSPTIYYWIRSILHQLSVKKQNKVASNLFDDKRLYINPIQSLPWNKHTQKGNRLC